MKQNTLGYLFTVIVDNGFKGRQFLLRNEDEINAFGISTNSVANAVSAGAPLFGMEVVRVNSNTVTCAPYDDIHALFKENKNYFSTVTQPVHGRIIDDGPYKNIEFSLYGTKEAEQFFTKTGVLNVVRMKQSSYRGCVFRLTSHRLAIPLHGKMTQEIADYLEKKYTRK